MDIARYFIERKVTSWMVTLILLVGGILAFLSLGRLEDPEFSIKQVNIITQYPGATPSQVEDEVTYLLEREMQNLPYVKQIFSTSTAGLSKLSVEMKDTIRGDTLGQVWDEVRKKIRDLEEQLPPGADSPRVVDDFSDVYGILYALSAETEGAFEAHELTTIASDLGKELALVEGVSKVTVSGAQREQINIEIPRHNLVAMGIPVEQIAGLLNEQNVVSHSGFVNVGEDYVRLSPTGEFNSLEELGLLTITSAQTGQTVKLKDIAEISRGYMDPSSHVIRHNGRSAIALGVSFLPDVNVVDVGEHVRDKLQSSMTLVPQGIMLEPIYFQGDEVEKAVNGFIMSLVQAVVIVIVVLLVFMGLKSGVLIGMILAITILGTFIVMDWVGLALQRISLGGLIVALGMLVDNAIVVTEGILIGLKRGKTKLQAASDVVKQTQWPLAGATVIAITAFAPMGLSPDSIGEFVGSLFWVLLISLTISWFTAVTLTPFFCDLLFKEDIAAGEDEERDPYRGVIFSVYKKILSVAMGHRWVTIALLVSALAGAGYGFTFVKQAFFPSSLTPLFYAELRYPSATNLETTQAKAQALEQKLADDKRVNFVTATFNQGLPRFILTYMAMESGYNNVQLVVRTHRVEDIDALLNDIHQYLSDEQPEAHFTLRKLQLGPGGGAKLETRFSGPDADVLRDLSEQAKSVYRSDPNLEGIRDDWKDQVKVLQPVFNAEKASELGISKTDYDSALLTQLQGQQVGAFRDGTKLLPIVATLPERERDSVDRLKDIQIFTNGTYVNLTEVTERFDIIWENPVIERRDRQRTITAMADPHINSPYNADQLFKRTRDAIEAIDLPPGYSMEFGGEWEDSNMARENMIRLAPMGYLFMFVITVLLFNSVKETLVVWFCIPLMMIGIATGLLVLDVAFGFMGFIGLLSLSGMVIKNGIVLIDQVNVEIRDGKDHYSAVFDAAVSRLRPVFMAALTTILGLAPLFLDPFFKDMAVVISFGLGFATVLTLVAVPTFYVVFFNARKPAATPGD
ncbi:efflux RND transporter permease subunit [Reinekea blandensis]|uniref:Transporter, AcrB/D/F family protein n=1 Tax=Reinekea blandensis MED297 TaxID=314283 RepID=A4BB84_9GAMM|nr:efflux RND transporter permease subunit [Reinekea blandensis]EAR10697.1 transporter, AcrB/D/F family protein [Reinekea sp. MED297] [Reinekea blandensis MED297]